MTARQKPACAPGCPLPRPTGSKRRHEAHRGGNRPSQVPPLDALANLRALTQAAGDEPSGMLAAAAAPNVQPGCNNSVCAGVVRVTVPGLRLVNPLNQRAGWRTVWRRGKAEKARVHHVLCAAGRGVTTPTHVRPWVVTVTRCGPGTLDALPASAKHVVDAVAEWIGVDDKHSDLVAYRYAQRREREWSVEICVEVVR